MPALRTTPLSHTWPQLLQPLGFTRRTIIWDAPSQVLQGDLGFRFKNGDDVREVLIVRMGRTFTLMGTALAIGIVVGVTLGIFIGLRQYSFWGFTFTGFSFVGISMPAFIAGIFGLYVFSVKLGWFPSGGMRTIGKPESFFDLLYHLVLPAGTLAIFNLATFMRYTRFSMLEVRGEDYVRTAKAKGLKPPAVTWRHVFRNALLPIVTVVGLSLPTLVAGALFTETIYSWPGMGALLVDAVAARDYPMVMGIMLVTALVVSDGQSDHRSGLCRCRSENSLPIETI